jgi:hypothetical protein
MTALFYLESLIAGTKISSIPVQASELEFLKRLMLTEQGVQP